MTNKAVPIIYNGGYYGTFVHWALLYFSGLVVESGFPFFPNGSSHQYEAGDALIGISEWRNFDSHQHTAPIYRVHPKTSKFDVLQDVISEILQSTGKAIYLTTSKHTLLTINNKFDKIWADGWMANQANELEENVSAWGSKKYDNLQEWQKREFLSYYIFKQHAAENEPLYSVPDKLFSFEIGDLFTDFEKSIRAMLDYVNLPCVRTNLSEIHSTWATLQIHYGKDEQASAIIEAVTSDKYMEWSNLTLVDEAFIQMHLRDLHNLDMICYNVNVFPTNTTDLRKILINV
jgi:hypothetical protein